MEANHVLKNLDKILTAAEAPHASHIAAARAARHQAESETSDQTSGQAANQGGGQTSLEQTQNSADPPGFFSRMADYIKNW